MVCSFFIIGIGFPVLDCTTSIEMFSRALFILSATNGLIVTIAEILFWK
jgi:hypothetical protein